MFLSALGSSDLSMAFIMMVVHGGILRYIIIDMFVMVLKVIGTVI